jgi:phytoene/squalene synthetase
MMRVNLKALDETYAARAVPPGTTRHLSWLFAAPEARAPLLGIYALGAEWQALMDPATDPRVSELKLAWWHEEMLRLAGGKALHPVSCYLASLPRAGSVDFSPLVTAIGAAAVQVGGAPLERAADLEPQSQALWGGPLLLASRLATEVCEESSLRGCTQALSAAHYLARAIRDYRREARAGRVVFAVDELLAAGVDNDGLAADLPPAHLERYLHQLRERAARYFEAAAQALARPGQRPHRHLLVLARLGLAHMSRRSTPGRRRFEDMILAWKAARRAR